VRGLDQSALSLLERYALAAMVRGFVSSHTEIYQ
jgi:hypothetical protein